MKRIIDDVGNGKKLTVEVTPAITRAAKKFIRDLTQFGARFKMKCTMKLSTVELSRSKMTEKAHEPLDYLRDKLHLVFAGTHEEFRRCCHDQGWIPGHHAIYVDDEMKLRGLDPKKVLVVRYGQYHRNKAVYSDYLKMLEATGAKALWI